MFWLVFVASSEGKFSKRHSCWRNVIWCRKKCPNWRNLLEGVRGSQKSAKLEELMNLLGPHISAISGLFSGTFWCFSAPRLSKFHMFCFQGLWRNDVLSKRSVSNSMLFVQYGLYRKTNTIYSRWPQILRCRCHMNCCTGRENSESVTTVCSWVLSRCWRKLCAISLAYTTTLWSLHSRTDVACQLCVKPKRTRVQPQLPFWGRCKYRLRWENDWLLAVVDVSSNELLGR